MRFSPGDIDWAAQTEGAEASWKTTAQYKANFIIAPH
jgi:hypothetical protein